MPSESISASALAIETDVPPARGWLRATLRVLATFLVILAIWYAIAFLIHISGNEIAARKMPYPHEVLGTMLQNPGTFIEATWQTASRAVVGFFLGLVLGLLVGAVMAQSRLVEHAIVPYVLASQMIPLVALVPILHAVLKDADLVRLYVTAYVSFFVLTIAVARGLKNVSLNAVELMESVDASRVQTMRMVRFPAAMPYIFTGLRIAAPLSLIGAILVDFLGARNGLGFLLVASLSLGQSQSGVLWAALVLCLLFGLIATQLVVLVERRVCFWEPAYRATRIAQ